MKTIGRSKRWIKIKSQFDHVYIYMCVYILCNYSFSIHQLGRIRVDTWFHHLFDGGEGLVGLYIVLV